MTDELYNKWKETQLNWDDSEFLKKKATLVMKMKWKKINEAVIKILEKEVIKKNEYLDFLDIGAGRGDFYKEIRELIKKYTGVEPSSKMLTDEIIEDDFRLVRGNGEEFMEKDSYDICLLKEVLDHCYDPEKVIKNGFDSLKRDGIIIITLPNKNAYYKFIFRGWAKKLEEEHKDHLYNFSQKEVIDMMQKSGFVIEEIISLNYLKLPNFMEKFLGIFPILIINWLLGTADSIGRLLLKDKGGSFIVTGRKESIREDT